VTSLELIACFGAAVLAELFAAVFAELFAAFFAASSIPSRRSTSATDVAR
jgi:hypothetical protein